MHDPNRYFVYKTPYRYWQNGLDVTWYVMSNLPMPLSERFFEVTCR